MFRSTIFIHLCSVLLGLDVVASAATLTLSPPDSLVGIRQITKHTPVAWTDLHPQPNTESVKQLQQPKKDIKRTGKGKKLLQHKFWFRALILCGFFGMFGFHRYYLGYTWQGVVQTLTFGGLLIWTMIDFVRILFGRLHPKNGAYVESTLKKLLKEYKDSRQHRP
jgi:TM2 domain-containing membrane protein YozV